MPYNTKPILVDVNNIPIPQYFDVVADAFKPLYGTGGGNQVVEASAAELLTQLQAQEYGTSQPQTATLSPNTDTLFTMAAECAYFDLINEGPGDVYIKVDAVAGIGGAGCLKLPEAMAYTLRQRGTVVHVIGAAASVVQIVGVR